MDCTLAQTGDPMPVLLVIAAMVVLAAGAALILSRGAGRRGRMLPLLAIVPLLAIGAIGLQAPDSASAAVADHCVEETVVPTPVPSVSPTPEPTLPPEIDCPEGTIWNGYTCVDDPGDGDSPQPDDGGDHDDDSPQPD